MCRKRCGALPGPGSVRELTIAAVLPYFSAEAPVRDSAVLSLDRGSLMRLSTTPLPLSYPVDMVAWYDLYCRHPHDKRGHDALLYLAEGGVTFLLQIAASICCEDALKRGEPEAKFLRNYRDRNAFGQSVSILESCLSEVDLIGVETAGKSLGAPGRLRAALGALSKLKDWRTVEPLEQQLKEAPPELGWFEAWQVLVEYRNKTLGHPQPEVIGTERFYEVMTPALAAAVSAVLWSDEVSRAVGKFPIASVDAVVRGKGDRCEVTFRGPNGYPERTVIVAPEGTNLVNEGSFVLERGDSGDRYRARLWRQRKDGKDGFELVHRIVPDVVLEGGARRAAPKVNVPKTSSELPHGLVTVLPGTVRAVQQRGGRPEELVLREPFAIGRWPVTQELYLEVLGESPSHFEGVARPVESVTWFDAIRFCNALSKLEHLSPVYPSMDERTLQPPDPRADGYRLPTEAEWLFACLGGRSQEPFPAAPTSAWFKDNSDGSTRPVGQNSSNGLGIYDMLGNVWEWCQDWFALPFAPGATPGGPVAGRYRTRRGGSWNDALDDVSYLARAGQFPGLKNKFTGFRIARSIH